MQKLIPLHKILVSQMDGILTLVFLLLLLFNVESSWPISACLFLVIIFLSKFSAEIYLFFWIREDQPFQKINAVPLAKLIAYIPFLGMWFYFYPMKVFSLVDKHNEKCIQRQNRLLG